MVLAAVELAGARLPGWSIDQLTGGQDPADRGLVAPSAAVRSLPRLGAEELQRAYLRADVLCSVPSSDGTSVSLLEGMASGCFPIVSDLPANREWVTDGENGLVVPVRDVPALAEAMVRAAADDGLRAQAAVENRSRIGREVTWEVAVERVAAATAALADR